MTNRLGTWLVALYLCLCLVLGGASAAGLWWNALLQLLSIPLLFWAIAPRQAAPLTRSGRRLLVLLGLALLVPVAQLIPLPPDVWTGLPGRDNVQEAYRLVGRPLPWLPISLAPYETLASLLWLLPALTILLALMRRGTDNPGAFGWAIVGAMAAGVLLGAMQIAGRTDSPWYFYRITNYGVNVGFFANANHMATLLVVSLPFLAALYATALRKGRKTPHNGPQFVIMLSAFVLVAVGLVINGSLAGLGLMVPVAIASVLMLLNRPTLPRWALPALAILTVGTVAAVLAGPFDNNLIGEAANGSAGSRSTAFRISLVAAMDYFPIGSGVGSFDSVYRMYEVPAQITNTYMNHAHSDYIELFLETGPLGVALIVLFLVWWGRQTTLIWRMPEVNHFARAATIASAAILAHSVVDYPLRTVAIAAIFATCCALMASANVRLRRSTPTADARPARHLSAE